MIIFIFFIFKVLLEQGIIFILYQILQFLGFYFVR